jgi:fucose 4-O-acetylase-like acetyltransferase
LVNYRAGEAKLPAVIPSDPRWQSSGNESVPEGRIAREMHIDKIGHGPPSPVSDRILFLDSLRAIGIIMVVGVHTLAYCMALPPTLYATIQFIVQAVAVRIFYFVDGYLFARKITESPSFNYPHFIRNSVLRLLIPWAIFSAIYIFARYVFETIGFFKENLVLGCPWWKIVLSAYGDLYAGQLFFLLSLFLIRVCSPLLKKLAATRSFPLVMMVFFGYFVVNKPLISFLTPFLQIPGGQQPIVLAVAGMQFYLFGIVLFKASKIVDVKKFFVPSVLLFVFSFFIPESVSFRYQLIQHLYLLSLFIFFTFFHNGVPILNDIGKNTMGIYLIHQPIVVKGVSLIMNKFILDPLSSYLSILVVDFVITYGLVRLINRVPYANFLFGIPYRHTFKKADAKSTTSMP